MPAFRLTRYVCVSVLLLSIGPIAYGQVPPTNDTSDANGNTGMGSGALQSNTTGTGNTASGFDSLAGNTTGHDNTASGFAALSNNTTGYFNSAVGSYALSSNTAGFNNTAGGHEALILNTTGSFNTAFGADALGLNTTGHDNTGSGISPLYNNTTGSYNSAFGNYALTTNTTGVENTASGFGALALNTTGSGNIALGIYAGYDLTIGSNNIDIGNQGVAGESGTIRVGNAGQHTRTFIAGIWGKQVSRGASVVVNSNGQLGVEESSERYKTDIASVGPASAKIQQLRPVTYRLKTDPAGELQYGLIAEEVDKVYPELVVRDDAGNVEGVRYDRLAPILLSELQDQQQKVAAQASQLVELKQQFAELTALNRAMRTALSELRAKESRVGRR
jgi:Chaperone of endosialidase